jgi:hypothetical protein
MYRKQNRPDMTEGCNERVTLAFILWIWNFSRRTKPKVVKLLESNTEKKIVWLRSPADVQNFLALPSAREHATDQSASAHQTSRTVLPTSTACKIVMI